MRVHLSSGVIFLVHNVASAKAVEEIEPSESIVHHSVLLFRHVNAVLISGGNTESKELNLTSVSVRLSPASILKSAPLLFLMVTRVPLLPQNVEVLTPLVSVKDQ